VIAPINMKLRILWVSGSFPIRVLRLGQAAPGVRP